MVTSASSTSTLASFERIEGAMGPVSAGTFSPDGSRVAVLAPGVGVQVVDVATGRRVGLPMFLDGPVILSRGLHWAEDDVETGRPGGLWVGSSIGPIEFAADPDRWREIAVASSAANSPPTSGERWCPTPNRRCRRAPEPYGK